jgi:hypothetical protein
MSDPLQYAVSGRAVYLVVACLVLGYLVGVAYAVWWFRRESDALRNDIADLYLSPEQLEAKYRTERPPDRPQAGCSTPRECSPPSRPPAAGEEH